MSSNKKNMIIIDELNCEVDYPTFQRKWEKAEFDRDLFIQQLGQYGEASLCDCDESTKRAVKDLIYKYTHPGFDEVAVYKKKYEDAAKKCDEATKKAEALEAELKKEKDRADKEKERADKAESDLAKEKTDLAAANASVNVLTNDLNTEKANGISEKERADKAEEKVKNLEEELKKANERNAELEAAQVKAPFTPTPTAPTAPTAPTGTAGYQTTPIYIKRTKDGSVGEAYLFYNGHLVPNEEFAVKAIEVFDNLSVKDFTYYYADVYDDGDIVPIERASKTFKA